MTTFLYLPSTNNARLVRRVDLANIGSLFAEVEEPMPRRGVSRHVRRIAAVVLVVLFALGDTVLVARPDALAACLVKAQKTISATAI